MSPLARPFSGNLLPVCSLLSGLHPVGLPAVGAKPIGAVKGRPGRGTGLTGQRSC